MMILFYSIFAAVFMVAAVHENAWKRETSSIKTVSHTWDNTEDVKEQISVSGQVNILELIEEEIIKFRQEMQSQGELMQETIQSQANEIKILNEKLIRQQDTIDKQGLKLDSQENAVKELKVSVQVQERQMRILKKQNVILKNALIKLDPHTKEFANAKEFNNFLNNVRFETDNKTELNLPKQENDIVEKENIPDNKDSRKGFSQDQVIDNIHGDKKAVSNKIPSRDRRAALYNGTGIAFSAYLSHEVNHMAIGHTIKCDKVLINDGNAYSPYTGAFTVPETGVYFLTFHIDAYSLHDETIVKLVVNNRNIVDADAKPGGVYGHQASGNSAIIQLNSGEKVWLEIYQVNDVQLYGSDAFRLTTFSGFMLY